MGRIPKPGHPEGRGRKIPAPEAPPTREEVSFCFKHWRATGKFSLAGCGENYVAKLVERLRDLSGIRMRELILGQFHNLRFHQIRWVETSEPTGFAELPNQLRDLTPYQFSITANEHGRVHGFVLGSVFHVVWLDREHRLYP